MSSEKILSNYVCNKLGLVMFLLQLECLLRALEQDIENLQKKLGGCLRENQNLQEELAEAYRIKSQLAELHGAALSKNKDLEKQVRFFQSSVAQAFAERDSSLMECEKAKEREEAVSRKFADFEERMREYQSEIDEQKHLNDDLQRELTELKAHTELSLKVILKFYDLRCRDSGCSSSLTIEEKCSILLGDSADNWSFSSDGGTSTLKYIASLEEEKESLKAKISKLQSNLRMGLEIEQHLQRNARILEKRQALYDGFLRNGLSELQKFYTCQKAEIMKILEEESLRLMKVVAEIQDKLTEICINTEVSDHPADEIQCCDSSCKDVHVTKDISPSTCRKSDYPADLNSVSFDESKALAQALQEKMEALMLFSQEQERYLLEKQRDLIVIEELQKNLSQVKDEKVKVLMELTKLKEQYLLLKGSAVKEGHDTGDSSKLIPGHDQQGMLKTMLKRTSLRHWMRKESNTIGHGSSDGNDHTVCKEHSVDVARLRVENAMLLEGVGTVEHLTSSVHRLHIVLLKTCDVDAPNTYRLLRWLEFGDASSQYFSNYDQATLLMCVAIFRGAILVAVNILWKALQKLRSIVECFKALYTAASHFPLQLSGGNLNSYILIQTLTFGWYCTRQGRIFFGCITR
uniref:Myosin heavy chain-related n=1 Tax=Zea mays TaxID=4577 RepID=A0A804RBQ0_MAIZE